MPTAATSMGPQVGNPTFGGPCGIHVISPGGRIGRAYEDAAKYPLDSLCLVLNADQSFRRRRSQRTRPIPRPPSTMAPGAGIVSGGKTGAWRMLMYHAVASGPVQ